MFCEQCGTKNDDSAKFCSSCGAAVANLIESQRQPQATVDASPTKKAYSSYAEVPWYRKNWFAIACAILFTPALLAESPRDSRRVPCVSHAGMA